MIFTLVQKIDLGTIKTAKESINIWLLETYETNAQQWKEKSSNTIGKLDIALGNP